MNKDERLTIVMTARRLIRLLHSCDDSDLADYISHCVASGEPPDLEAIDDGI